MKNKAKRIFASLVAIVMLLSMTQTAAFAADIDSEINVSESQPQNEADEIITTYEQLKAFADRVNNGDTYEGKLVRLDANIELGGEANSWTAIGSSKTPFKGTFDGGYHVINGLYIASGSYIGFFGAVTGGTVKNLVVKGEVKGSASVAGVVGSLSAGSVINCANEVNVSGSNNIGGVVGAVSGVCEISGCRNSGNVSGTTGYIGGVVGSGSNSTVITNCYSTGVVKGPATVGGVFGGHKAYKTSAENCFDVGNVIDSTGKQNNIGAVSGATKGDGVNCYYLAGSANYAVGSTASADGIKTAEEMKAADFAALLGDAFESGAAHPVLAWEKNISTAKFVRPAFSEKTELSAQLASYIRLAVNSAKVNNNLAPTDSLLGNSEYLSGASSTATDWMALAMGRFGYRDIDGTYRYMIDEDGYDAYLDAMKSYIEKTYAENNGILHSVKATEWHRAAVTIAALQGNPLSFGTYNGNPINLIADGSYNCVVDGGVGKQGMNGLIWGLIALDAGSYDVPSGASFTREKFIEELLKLQLTDGVNGNEYGGWVLGGYGSSSDVDITAMTIQALAPYYNDDTVYTYTNASSKKQVSKTVRQCVDEALDRLGSMLNSDAGFSSWDTGNVECIAQVVTALCSIGVNPATDSRFITQKGETLLDGMLKFRLDNGGFCHVHGGGWNSMATDQATYALVSYWRFENGLRSLYDMRAKHTKNFETEIEVAESAISEIPEPTASDYKAKIKLALEKTDAISLNERRYISNYETLATALSIAGGREKLDTDEKYVTSIEVTKLPSKDSYYTGEKFNKTGMVI
ncbi:MAG: hypothetical protein NC110_05755, partial [Ruminococcus sp.]|nr:hypothetical protein [Ruminococcus sp.]